MSLLTIDYKINKENLRGQFPLLASNINGKQLAYLDNAATTQKPQVVIDVINRYYREINSNVNRGVHWLSAQSTKNYEHSRTVVQKFLNAKRSEEIIFTKGTTESINLVAYSWGLAQLKPGDEVLISGMEHHSNITPWQMACHMTGALLRVIPVTESGELDFRTIDKLINERTKIVAVMHVSNTLGTVNPIKSLVAKAHQVGAKILIDGAQAVGHMPVDVQNLDADFYAFSGHKVYGPTGIGVLYGKFELLKSMRPYQFGGEMVQTVSFEKTTFKEPPHRFEAGTPPIASAIGLAVALEFLQKITWNTIIEKEHELAQYAYNELRKIEGLKLLGHARERIGVFSFTMEAAHAHDVATILDLNGVAVRAGHLCTMPLMKTFNVPAVARVSISFYNTKEDIDQLINGLKKVIEVFK
jgi:cysteine desulfurase/selenocysteine lyase